MKKMLALLLISCILTGCSGWYLYCERFPNCKQGKISRDF